MRWSPTSRFSVSSATPHISRRSRRKRRHEHRARHAGRFRQIVRAVLPARDGGRRAHLRLLAREPETVRQGGARHHRRRGQAVAVGERDPISGHMTTGHEWHGIKEIGRTKERRGGKRCVRTCRIRAWPEHSKTKKQTKK